jgi:Phage integrase family
VDGCDSLSSGWMRKPNGDRIKTYQLSRKTILNLVGVVKLILGKKVWMTWELDLGKPDRPEQRYFTEAQLKQIVDRGSGRAVPRSIRIAGRHRDANWRGFCLHFADLDLDNCVIHVRRGVWNGREQAPKTVNAVREIDIDLRLAEMLRRLVGAKKAGRVFEARNGSPISGNNVLKRALNPLLNRLGIPKAGLHAFRHSRVTMLRKNGTPEDLQKQWIGHSSLRNEQVFTHSSRT